MTVTLFGTLIVTRRVTGFLCAATTLLGLAALAGGGGWTFLHRIGAPAWLAATALLVLSHWLIVRARRTAGEQTAATPAPTGEPA